jgi:hypothetical protein
VATRLLRDDNCSGVEEAPVLGPEDLSFNDMAAAKNQGLDNAVRRTPENSTPTSFRQWCEEVLKPAVAGL